LPELPEVETIVRAWRPRLEGRRISRFRSSWPRNVTPSARAVARALRGRTVQRVWRRAKYIVFDLSPPGHLLVHLRMSGRLAAAGDPAARRDHVRAVWEFDEGGALWLVDMRKFGTITLVNDIAAATAHLGVEPLEQGFTRRRFGCIVRARSRLLKPLLLDQSVVAGLGNIYADEALYAAGVHPLTRTDALSDVQVAALVRAIRSVLRRAIRHQGTSIDWVYPGGRMQDRLRVYKRGGRPCRRCGVPIEVIRVAQRGTHFCPRCQPNNSEVAAVDKS
jgi:formamidopyrimidine-DNA glycosylase